MATNEMTETAAAPEAPARKGGGDGFGVNEWLIDELYEQYRNDPQSVSPRWREFFEDYRPADEGRQPSGQQQQRESSSSTATKEADEDQAEGREAQDGQAKDGQQDGQAKEKQKSDEAEDKESADQDDEEDEEESSEGKAEAEDDEDEDDGGSQDFPGQGAEAEKQKGISATIAKNMDESLKVPTATSVREVPAKLLEVNRTIINNYFQRIDGGTKVSFTHLIAYAMLRALEAAPNMRSTYTEIDGRPGIIRRKTVNLGLAIDVERKGTRTLLVPNIKDADTLDFKQFHSEYEDVVRKVRRNKLEPSDFEGTTMTITNAGTIGTIMSVPRLMKDQSVILGVGAINYPAQYQACDPKTIATLGLSKTTILTSTYDHRVIQGAESGSWLARIHQLLLGEEDFYDDIFRSLGVPYEPARWREDRGPIDSEYAMLEKQTQVDALAHMYRVRGHLIADLDPLSAQPSRLHAELDPTTYGLSIWDLDREFFTQVSADGRMRLGDLLGVLRDAYCRTMGIEYMHMSDPNQKRWVQDQVEGVDWTLTPEHQRWILERLNAAEAFERFIHTKYVGHKRFSLEGAESFLVIVERLLELACTEHMDEVFMGMAHRGRLNVLANVVGKSYEEIFSGFEGDIDPNTVQGTGDVKYHIGESGVYRSREGGEVRVSIPSNPSHLEAVNPVVEGMTRAKQDLVDQPGTFTILPMLVHGDAAFAGEGVVQETLNLSKLDGYKIGGTIHVIINNQLGFTTPPEAGRSSKYPTDIAKAVSAPIFHVNGDDPEACVRVAELAFKWRQTFHHDVVIDLVCYRKFGHNEADDPSFTQPLMYQKIEQKRSVRKLYTERLVNRGDITMEEAEEALEDFQDRLDEAFERTQETSPPEPAAREIREPAPPEGPLPPVETGVDKEVLDRIVERVMTVPDGFTMHPKLERLFGQIRERYDEQDRVDWPLGEQFAFGSLLLEGITVRLSGQDSRRGTFSQRHSVVVDYETGEEFEPLKHLSEDQGKWFIYNSLLSEYAALGFEYGYSLGNQKALVMWEAQFGDFINNAQAIVDEFIVSGEEKWGQESDLVLLLPHGYEGQGPDHSSARIERFLQLAADDKLILANPTTAAQYFHLLRRQKHRDERHVPMIVFTPKSLLRSKHSRSRVRDFTEGHFRLTLDDPRIEDRDKVRRVILCQGKVAYDALDRRDEEDFPAAVVRTEQIYPWPEDEVLAAIRSYPNAEEVLWLQEEPENMGPWFHVHGRLHKLLRDDYKLMHVARHPSPSPATGSKTVHDYEQEQLLRQSFEGLSS